MTTSLHVRARVDTSTDYQIIDDKQRVQKADRLHNKWSFANVVPVKRWELNEKDERVYARILSTAEGRDTLNLLKNDKTNSLINEYIQIEKENILTRKGSKLTPLGAFLNDVLKTPIKAPQSSDVTRILGITKKQIWRKFHELGLVAKYRKQNSNL